MPPLQDITNNNQSFHTEPTVFGNPATPSFTRRETRSHPNTYVSPSPISSTGSNREQNVRFPSRLSLRSYTEMYIDVPSTDNFLSNSLDDDCFLDSSLEFICNDNSLNKSLCFKRNISINDSFIRRKKRLSLPAKIDECEMFKKLNDVSRNHLVDLVCGVSKLVLANNKSVKKEDIELDVEVLLTREQQLLRNIKRALPERVYGATRDAVSFKRVEVHLLLFKQEVLEQLRSLCGKSYWNILSNYIIESWNIVERLPQWDNSSHNTHRMQIFSLMASNFRKCLQHGKFDDETLKSLKNRVLDKQSIHVSITKLLLHFEPPASDGKL